MSGQSQIQWTDATWNPVVGCTRVSAGCNHCYAFQLHDQRHVAWKRGRWDSAPEQYHQPFSRVQLMPERLSDPLHWRKPRRVFVDSMADLFHDDVPDEFIGRVFGVMRRTPQHIYQILTKRPERMLCVLRELTNAHALKMLGEREYMQQWPLPNVWLGVSVEDQCAADERIPLLLQTPAAVRFLSCEPLLGPVNLIGDPGDGVYGPIWHKRAVQTRTDYGTGTEWDVELEAGIDWVIIGGESGKHARVMHPDWASALVEQCRTAGVAVFMKQLGSELAYLYSLKDKHGGDMAAWPPDFRDLQVREFPQTTQEDMEVVR